MEVSRKLVVSYFSGRTTSAEEAAVEQWLSAHPENASLALGWIKEEEQPTEQKTLGDLMMAKERVWANTQEQIPHLQMGRPAMRFSTSYQKQHLKKYLAIAAALVLVTAFAWTWLRKQDTLHVAAAYGQTRHVILPDQSRVILNGNSRMRYQASWEGRPREIWLDGEAFFDVRHLRTDSSFTVHLSNGKNIRVLGTQFNVIDRQKRSCIVLKSGSIKLSLPGKQKQVYLRPGDMVRIADPRAGVFEKTIVNPETYSSWTEGRWRLEGTSLAEMLQKVEENYGVTVSVENRNLLAKKASGSIPLGSGTAFTLIEDIANLFELHFIKKDNKLILAK